MGTLHHLKVGCADSSVIAADDATFLVDCHNVADYAHLLPTGKVINGVFITHQHRDHFSGLQYLRDKKFTIKFLIYSPYERRRGDNSVQLDEWNEFEEHRDYFAARGTEVRAPYRQDSFDPPFWRFSDQVRFHIIGPHREVATSDTRQLHDASLVIKATLGKRACLFAGDASNANLAKIAETTNNYCDDILHASHHGSANGADESFIKKAGAAYTVISTAEGVYESVPHAESLALYAKHTATRVYRTDKDGSLEWKF